MVIQQIVELAPVDFKHGNSHGKVSLLFLEVVDSPFEEIFDGQLLNAVHSEGLATSRLAVSENSDNALVEDQIEDRLHRVEVEVLIRFFS